MFCIVLFACNFFFSMKKNKGRERIKEKEKMVLYLPLCF